MEKYLEPIFESFEPLNEDEVSEIERSSGVKLPSNYRNFLLKYGRCMFSVEASIETGSEEFDISTWMGGRENGNILQDINLHPDYKEQKLVPIAETLFNDRFVLNGNTGKVQFIKYSAGFNEVIDIADSYDEFVGKIKFED